MPPTTTVCYDESEIIDLNRPICELVGTIVTDTGIQGFCPDIPNIEKRCPDEAFVQEFIDSGRNYDLYFRSQADSSLPGQVSVLRETDGISFVSNDISDGVIIEDYNNENETPNQQSLRFSRAPSVQRFLGRVLG